MVRSTAKGNEALTGMGPASEHAFPIGPPEAACLRTDVDQAPKQFGKEEAQQAGVVGRRDRQDEGNRWYSYLVFGGKGEGGRGKDEVGFEMYAEGIDRQGGKLWL